MKISHQQKEHKTKKGFTLIEILMVLGIIVILVSIVLTSISSIQQRAQEASYLAYLRSVGAAVEVALALGGYDNYSAWEGTVSGIPYAYSAATDDCWSGYTSQTEFVSSLSEAATISDCVTSPFSTDYGALLSPRGNASGGVDGIWLFLYIAEAANVDLCTKLAWEETWISGDFLMCGAYIRAL